MEPLSATYYGDQFAQNYDRWPRGEATPCVDALARLSEGPSVLELGVGTGRIALPLAMKGYQVSGVDISDKMLEKLRAKEGAERLSLVCGNFADVPVEGRFDLIYIAGLSFNYLMAPAEQLRCFRNVSHRLTERGAFVIESFVPNGQMFKLEGTTVGVASGFTSDSAILHYAKADVARHVLDINYVVLGNEGTKVYRETMRLVWPAEFDLMAETAGLRLDERWSSWERDKFTSQSQAQIAIYRPHH